MCGVVPHRGGFIPTSVSDLKWVNVVDFGAKGDGSDDAVAIQAAINSLPAQGGVVYFPTPSSVYGTTATITLGNGTPTTESTKHGIFLLGAVSGTGTSVSGIAPNCGVCIQAINGFGSSSTKPILQINGPIHNIRIQGFQLDCNNKAGIGLQVIHATQCHFEDINVRNWRGWCYDLNTQTGSTSFAFGCCENQWIGCGGNQPSASVATASGIRLDGNNTTSLDSCRNTFIGGTLQYGASGTGLQLIMADNNCFMGTEFQGAGAGITFTAGVNPAFPGGNGFVNASFGSVSVDPTITSHNNWFIGWISDDPATYSQQLNIIQQDGITQGQFTNLPFFYASVADSATLSNPSGATAFSKTFSVPARRMNKIGGILRFKAWGTLTCGTNTNLTLAPQWAGFSASLGLIAITTGTYEWSIDGYAIVRTTGATGTVEFGGGTIRIGTASITSTVDGIQTVDLTAAQTAQVAIIFGTTDAGNSAIMKGFILEGGYAGATS